MERYSKIATKLKREFLLLQGTGCKYKKCTFCDYYNDTSNNPFNVNKLEIDKITGEFGIVDIINSGSVFELDTATLTYLRGKCEEKNVKIIWFEAHFMYKDRLSDIINLFPNEKVKFRIGIETFDAIMRQKWNKGIPIDADSSIIATKFSGCCLLVCVEGQTKEQILTDIATAEKYFEYYSVNVFINNSTPVKRDQKLVEWFVKDVYKALCPNPKCEILLSNTDLGVG